jgi:hypothetical protein
VADFRHLATNKRVGESSKGDFEDLFFFKKSPYLEKNKIKSRQNSAGFQKRSNSPPGQDSSHLLLFNAEDPRQYTYLRNLK